MNWFRWRAGRQGGGYRTMLLGLLPFADLWLLHMPTGSVVEPHRDPVEGKAHHRVNIILKAPIRGGLFKASGLSRTWLRGRVIRFRPDLVEHEVTEVEEGSRWALSIGWVISCSTTLGAKDVRNI